MYYIVLQAYICLALARYLYADKVRLFIQRTYSRLGFCQAKEWVPAGVRSTKDESGKKTFSFSVGTGVGCGVGASVALLPLESFASSNSNLEISRGCCCDAVRVNMGW